MDLAQKSSLCPFCDKSLMLTKCGQCGYSFIGDVASLAVFSTIERSRRPRATESLSPHVFHCEMYDVRVMLHSDYYPSIFYENLTVT